MCAPCAFRYDGALIRVKKYQTSTMNWMKLNFTLICCHKIINEPSTINTLVRKNDVSHNSYANTHINKDYDKFLNEILFLFSFLFFFS